MNNNEENLDLFGDESFSEKLLEHLPDISDEEKLKWPRDLAALIDIYQAALMRMDYKEEDANRITYTLIVELSRYCGGRFVYIPLGDSLEKAIRDVKLYKDWRDHKLTVDDLAKKYRTSLQNVYRVINKQRQYHINKIQPQLF